MPDLCHGAFVGTGETGGRRHCLLCPCVYRIELKFPLCFHFVEGLCSLRGGGAVEAEKMGEVVVGGG